MLRRPFTAAVALVAALALFACGGDDEPVSVPTAPVSTPTTLTTQTATTQTQTTATTPPTSTGQSPPAQEPGSGGTPAPQGSSGGSPSGGGGSGEAAQQRFEQYCRENPNACGE